MSMKKWQIAISTSIIISSFIHIAFFTLVVGGWIGWTLNNVYRGTRLLPIQIVNIIVATLIGIYLL